MKLATGFFVAALAAFAFQTSTASADTVDGTRSDRLAEKSHIVRMTLARGHAELVVERTVYNGGARHDQAMFHIDLPPAAVATGLRTLGSLRGRPHWFAGELMEAEAAAEKYRELTGIGGYYPKDPALLSWRSQDHLALQVFPCPPLDNKSIEYTLTMPTSYAAGRHSLSLPAMGTEGLLARVTLSPKNPRDRLFVDGKPFAAGGRVALKRDRSVMLELLPGGAQELEGALASFPVANGRALSRFRIEAAPKLSTVPRGAHIVVVLDASRSVSEAYLSGSVAASSAYLSHFPEARVEVLTFNRTPHPRYGRFLGVRQAIADLAAAKIDRKNGSHVDAALAEADRLLSGVRPGSAKRVVVFTDARTRSALTPERVRGSVGKSGALVHIGIHAHLDPELEPLNAHPWAPAARQTGGLLWKVGASSSPTETAEHRAVFEHWARPMKIRGLKVEAQNIPAKDVAIPKFLNEGEGITDHRIAHAKVGWVRVSGELWSKPVRFALVPGREETKRWTALTFGSELLHELTEPEMMTLAMHGGAVSPVTSYLAIEPGVRPSTEGLDWGAGSGTGFGRGFGRVRMGATSVSASPPPPFDPVKYLTDNLSLAYTRCGGKAGTATVQLETTIDEVVDVTSIDIRGKSDRSLSGCLEQAAWDLDLPDRFEWPWRAWMVRI